MKEIRSMIPYDDITVGTDFNSRKTFRVFVQDAFTTDAEGRQLLRPDDELAQLNPKHQGILEALMGLAMSLDRNKLVQPLTVREGGPARTNGRRKCFLIAGERRYRAIGILRQGRLKDQKSSKAQWNTVEVKFSKENTQANAALNLIENLQREDLEPMEEAQALSAYMADYKLTQAQMATQFGKSEPYISQRLSLLTTTPAVKAALEKGTIKATHVREMVTLPGDKQKKVLEFIEDQQAKGQKVSAADVKEEADKHKEALGIKHTKKPKEPKDDPTFDGEKVKYAKDLYEGVPFAPRPRTAVLEQIGALHQRMERPTTGEATKQASKQQIAALEWYLGVRKEL